MRWFVFIIYLRSKTLRHLIRFFGGCIEYFCEKYLEFKTKNNLYERKLTYEHTHHKFGFSTWNLCALYSVLRKSKWWRHINFEKFNISHSPLSLKFILNNTFFFGGNSWKFKNDRWAAQVQITYTPENQHIIITTLTFASISRQQLNDFNAAIMYSIINFAHSFISFICSLLLFHSHTGTHTHARTHTTHWHSLNWRRDLVESVCVVENGWRRMMVTKFPSNVKNCLRAENSKKDILRSR